jgi:hypothetical protein
VIEPSPRAPTVARSPFHQIVCLTCRYRREWATVLEAIADGQRHRAEHAACETPALVTPVRTLRENTDSGTGDPPA